jgi:hypothetical protein
MRIERYGLLRHGCAPMAKANGTVVLASNTGCIAYSHSSNSIPGQSVSFLGSAVMKIYTWGGLRLTFHMQSVLNFAPCHVPEVTELSADAINRGMLINLSQLNRQLKYSCVF